MEHTFKIEKELKITTENIVDCVLCCEAGGFDYWGELCSDENTCWMNEDDKKRLARFLSNERGESGVYPWFSSTGRKKPWCE